MKLFRIIVVALFVLTLFGNMASGYVAERRTDTTYPEISFDSETLRVPVDAGEAALLSGVTAYDKKDGDLTDRIIVESISNFLTDGVCNVTYAVMDSDNHVSKAQRRLEYDNYRAPRFTMSDDMIFTTGSSFNVLDILGAQDVIDGDISGRIKLIASDLNVNVSGVYAMKAQVTNSKGDVSYLEFQVVLQTAVSSAPRIELTDYLIYLGQNETFDPRAMVASVTQSGGATGEPELTIDSGVNVSEPGTYMVDYSATDANGRTGVARLIVVVEAEDK